MTPWETTNRVQMYRINAITYIGQVAINIVVVKANCDKLEALPIFKDTHSVFQGVDLVLACLLPLIPSLLALDAHGL